MGSGFSIRLEFYQIQGSCQLPNSRLSDCLPAQAREFQRALSKADVKADLVFFPHQSHISETINVASEHDPIVQPALTFMK
jgi:hypothetical protein